MISSLKCSSASVAIAKSASPAAAQPAIYDGAP
jgi:hypothetical protein